jgi:hypothetical protein
LSPAGVANFTGGFMDDSHYSIDMLKKVAFRHEIDNVVNISSSSIKSDNLIGHNQSTNSDKEIINYLEQRIRDIDNKYKNF